MAEEQTAIERTTPGVTPQQRLRALGNAATARWQMMQPRQRTTLVASFFMLAAMAALLIWWSGRPEWRVLFNGLESSDLQQVEQQLATAQISYQPTADGSGVQVPSDQLDKARMAVAAKGMPASGRLGFELFDKPNWVGSEFDEKVNYQRALEGELEHTIATIEAVRSARVHLVLPRQSLFASEERPATASVVLKLRRAALPREQADSIRSLVAGAVENLHADQVTLVDADGRSDLSIHSARGGQREEESAIEQKLVAMLEPLAGPGNVRATVNIRYDEGSEEHTDEVYDPQNTATVSVQRSEQSSSQPSKTAAPVGAASNTPAAKPAERPPLLQTADKKDASALQTQIMREESSSYAVTRHMVHTQTGPGRVQHIAAAVVVNDRAVVDANRMTTNWKARSPEEMRRLEQLAQAAVGFDGKRGDSVVVENIAFTSNVPEAKEPVLEHLAEQGGTLLRTQPGLLRTLSLVVCCALVFLFIARPLVRHVGTALQPALAAEQLRQISGGEEADHGPLQPLAQQRVLLRVSEQMRAEPNQSTRILESWIGATDGEGE